MIAVLQRVSQCTVRVAETEVGAIGQGLVVFLGVSVQDTAADADYLTAKIPHLRIFEDDDGKMNRSLIDAAGSLMVVSQFTLLGDCRKGRRPSFIAAAAPEQAEPLYQSFVHGCRSQGIPVATGRFGAHMAVNLINDGPVTLIVESPGHNGGRHAR